MLYWVITEKLLRKKRMFSRQQRATDDIIKLGMRGQTFHFGRVYVHSFSVFEFLEKAEHNEPKVDHNDWNIKENRELNLMG